MKKLLKEYLTFTRRERNGAVILLIAILIVIFFPQIQSLFEGESKTDFSAFKKEIEEFEKQANGIVENDSSDDSQPYQYAESYPANKSSTVPPLKALHLFYFDPNKIGTEEWKQLGVNERTAATILKYISKGGKFKSADDLKKIYGFTGEDFKRLASYVKIEPGKGSAKTDSFVSSQQYVSYTPKSRNKVDINTADSIQLISLNGIGPVLSSRIIKFRARLGGFINTEQLLDVYGLRPETYDLVKDRIEVSSPNITMISVNTASADELKNNPYFNYKIANAIISYRTQHGLYKTLEEIKNCELIDDALFNKVAPYLSL